MIRQSVFTQA